MKKAIILFFFVLCIGNFAYTQGDGINFENAPWAEILQKAAAENKIIFVNAYTDWCGPCKAMSKKVFTRQEVADYYNRNFINVKMNMEKGEGTQLANKYNVIAYPTLLFIDKGGAIVHRAVGYHDTDNFLELGATASTPGLRLSGLEERYTFGDRSPKFLYDYTFARAETGDGSHGAIAQEYLATQDDWSTEKNLTFLFRFTDGTEGEMFDYLLANKNKFVGLFGETPVARKLQYLIASSVRDTKEDSALQQVERLYKKVYPQRAAEMTSEYAMMYYLRADDIEKYTETAKKHFDKYGMNDWESLNETAWNFYEVAEVKKDLKQAIKWAQRSVELNSNYYNNDTLAALYFKAGKKKKAIRAAQEAINIAKRTGEDYSATVKMLEEM